MFTAIGNFLRALAEGLGLARQRDAAKQSPAMQANAAAKTDQQIKDEARAAVADRDLEKIRRLGAE